MLCTQVLNGLVSALGVMNFEAGTRVRRRRGQLQPEGRAGLASQKKAAYVERYGGRSGRRLALPDRIAGVDRG